MFKDKTVRALMFGATAELKDPSPYRVTTINFPATGIDDKNREIRFPTADGLLLSLLKRIETLETEVSMLRIKKN